MHEVSTFPSALSVVPQLGLIFVPRRSIITDPAPQSGRYLYRCRSYSLALCSDPTLQPDCHFSRFLSLSLFSFVSPISSLSARPSTIPLSSFSLPPSPPQSFFVLPLPSFLPPFHRAVRYHSPKLKRKRAPIAPTRSSSHLSHGLNGRLAGGYSRSLSRLRSPPLALRKRSRVGADGRSARLGVVLYFFSLTGVCVRAPSLWLSLFVASFRVVPPSFFVPFSCLPPFVSFAQSVPINHFPGPSALSARFVVM